MTSKIQELAEEASDPEEAGRKMRQLYFTNCKLTNRQLTVDLLKKLLERGVGTHDVENLSLKLIKGEPRRNPEIVKTLIRIKLEDAQKWQHRIRKQSLKEKAELYRLINRRGLIKEEFWSALRRDVERRWRKGKEKNQKKADRLEVTYKGARPYTGMVENIRVGDRELGEEEEIEKVPVAAGTNINATEVKVLNLDPRFRDWCKITVEDVETDIDVALDNMRREIDRMEENEGKSLSEAEEAIERKCTNPIDFEAKEVDFGKIRSTAMKQNKFFEMAKPVNRTDEMRLQNLKNRLLVTTREVLKKTNDEKGLPKTTCYTQDEIAGIKSLMRKRKNEGVVISGTDKSQSSGIMSEEEWLASLEPHTSGDQVVAIDEVDNAEKKMTGVAFQMARALRMGAGHDQEEKIRQNLKSEFVEIPKLTAKIKDHKEVVDGDPVKVRPVCGAVEAPCGQLSNILSEVVNALTQFEDKHKSECRSSEEMRSEVKSVNTKLAEEKEAVRTQDERANMGGEGITSPTASEGGTEVSANAHQGGEGPEIPIWQQKSRRVVGSTDFKSYYPRLPVQRAAEITRGFIERSEVKIMTDDKELGLFLASTMSREEVVRLNLGDVVQERLHKAGAAPGITSREILSRGPACPTKWKEPRRSPTEEERRRMLGIMVEFGINMCMTHHFYMHEEKVKRQGRGAGIGLRLSEALGRAFGLHWDDKLLKKLERLDWKPKMLKRYVDDLNTVVIGVKPGTRYNELEEKLEIVEDQVENDQEKEIDEITMNVFGAIANSIEPNIEVEVDYPSKYEDKMMPILDMKMAINNENEVEYMFYRKPQSNKFTMLARSALSSRVKRATMSNDALRRLLCCSPNLDEHKRVEVMEEFARMLKRSGYSQKFRYEVISDAVQGYKNMQKREQDGGQPVDRPRDYDEEGRRIRKEEKRKRWYRREPRGTSIREGSLIIPPAPDEALAKALKKVCEEELKSAKMALNVQERGGRQLGQVLGITVPGASTRKHCLRPRCFPCNSGQEGVCRRTGVGYEISCKICEQTMPSKYSGETGRNLFMRGLEHLTDLEKKVAEKPLWKHIQEKHQGRMEVTPFEHFEMSQKGTFLKPQRRKANEGVRISHLNPDTRMNSRDEFRQGTNIVMRAVRGLGV